MYLMHSKDLLSEEIHGSERRGIFDLKNYKGLKIPGDLPQILLHGLNACSPPDAYVEA